MPYVVHVTLFTFYKFAGIRKESRVTFILFILLFNDNLCGLCVTLFVLIIACSFFSVKNYIVTLHFLYTSVAYVLK